MRPPQLGAVRSAFLAATTAVALSAGLLPAAPSTAASPAAPAERATQLRVGTFNVNSDVPLDRWGQAFRDFQRLVDVGGMQEVAGPKKAAVMQQTPGVGSYRPQHFLQNPVFWSRSLFELVDGRGVKIAEGRRIENKSGPGTIYKRASIATVARLRSRSTGQTVSFVNVHLLPGAVQGGKRVPGHPIRFQMYKEEVRNLARLVKEEKAWAGGPVWVLGDFNVTYPGDKKVRNKRLAYATMRRKGLVACWEARREIKPGRGSGSRGGAYLDVIWSEQRATSAKVYRSQEFRVSDHFPVVATYAVP